jgi:hypothetical protein
MPDPSVAIVVPWRAGDRHRERAWAWCRAWWEQFGWPIFEVEHPPPEPFNRAWTANEGARRAWPWDVLVLVDADVFEQDPQQVRDGVASCFETGRLTIPHTVGADLSERGTQQLLAGEDRWERQVMKRRPVCTSRVTIVREDLYEAVGGFDERFRGWGHEDVAFFHATRSLRGVDQLPGTAYHLWHQPSFPIAKRTREYIAGGKLVDRYLTADRNGFAALRPILQERKPHERWDRPEGDVAPPPSTRSGSAPSGLVDLIVITAGRRTYLERTLASFGERVHGDFAHRLILDDSGDGEYATWLKENYPDFEIHSTPGRIGYTKAIRRAWVLERHRGGAPYVMHLEEDFVFDRDVDVAGDMIAVLESDRKLAQVALLRGPFFPPELDAGGIVEEDPGAYEHRNGVRPHLVHRKFFTTNPCIYRRSLLRLGWPLAAHSESVFTRTLVRRGYSFALVGDGEPWVTHIGVERTNHGY